MVVFETWVFFAVGVLSVLGVLSLVVITSLLRRVKALERVREVNHEAFLDISKGFIEVNDRIDNLKASDIQEMV